MVQWFQTKKDVNGNRVAIRVDHDARKFQIGYFMFYHQSDVTATVTKKKLYDMCDELRENGYREVLKIR